MTTDRYVPIFDGNLQPDQPGVVQVLIPTRENIEALRDRGSHLMAFELQRSKISAEAIRLLSSRGVRVPAAESAENLHELLRDPERAEREDFKFLDRVVEIARQRVAAGQLELTPDIRAALQILLHFRNLSIALAKIADADMRELWAGSVLSASSMGFTVGSVWVDDLAEDFRPAEEFADISKRGGQARALQKAWWWGLGLERCLLKRAADPTITTAALIVALKVMFKPLLDRPKEERPDGQRDLPETESGWRSAIEKWEKDGSLPRKATTP